MKRAYQISAIVWLAFAGFVARESAELKFFTPLGPGPGFFPFGLSVVLALLAAAMLYQATFSESTPLSEGFFPSKAGYLRIGALVLALTGSIVLMEPLGFRLTMLAFLLFLLLTLGRHHAAVTALIAVAGSFGTYYVFDSLLKIHLPIGVFGV